MLPASLRLAGGFLSVLPVRPVPDPGPRTVSRAMVLAPVAVVPLALLAGLVWWAAAAAGLPGLVGGLLVLGTLALGTRAMHLDGLADTVDGLGASWDRARALDVMRRGDVGPMGVVALLIIIGLQAVALGTVVTGLRGGLIVTLIICCSRGALVLVCRRGVPAARSQGLGVAVASSVPVAAAAIVWLVILAAVGLASVALGFGLIGGLGATALAAVVVLGLVRHCIRRLGGVTGDVMGAAIELAFTIMIIGVAG